MPWDKVEVTSARRPDTGWRFTDPAGHEHRWYAGDVPAQGYDPMVEYSLPTTIFVKDGEEYFDDLDDEPHPVGHLECVQCASVIEPGYCADTSPMFVRGLWRPEPVKLTFSDKATIDRYKLAFDEDEHVILDLPGLKIECRVDGYEDETLGGTTEFTFMPVKKLS